MSLPENRWQSPYEEEKRKRDHYNIFLLSSANNNKATEPSPGACPVHNARFIEYGLFDMRCPICGLKRTAPSVSEAQQKPEEQTGGGGIKSKKPSVPGGKRGSFVISQDKFKKPKPDNELRQIAGGSGIITSHEESEEVPPSSV